jgi:fatty-acyl-CoA synthase
MTAARPWLRAETLGGLLDRRAGLVDDNGRPRDALVFPDERASYPELAARSHRLAAGLLGLGVGRGDRVGLLLPASVDLVALLVAVTRIGAIAVPVNARYKSHELRQIVTHSGMCLLVTAAPAPGEPDLRTLLTDTFPDLADTYLSDTDTAAPRCAGAPELRRVVLLDQHGDPPVGGFTPGTELARAARSVSAARVRELTGSVATSDTAVLVYTSGTTSAPKGAMLSHRALTRLAAGIAHERMRLTGQDRVWTGIPLFHGGGITFALTCLSAGAAFVHPRFFDPATTLALLVRERVTVALAAFETIWLPVLGRPDFADHDLSRIRVVMAVGVPQRLRAMAGRLPDAVHISCVAMTESSAFLTLNRLDDPLDKRVTTGGHPMPGMTCRVVDPGTGADRPAGVPGELWFRGPSMFDGYFRDPELTARVIDEDGWFHSGDVVTRDEDGRLSFVSRLKDMIKVGGENVAAAEVEGFLLGHPSVRMAQVVAAPDAYYVEVPAAFVELEPGTRLDERELIDYCVGRIASYRVPRYVRFVTEWPMSGTKIKKVELRAAIRDELAAARITEAPRVRSNPR